VLPRVPKGRQDALPHYRVVFYVYGAGGNLIQCGNELRQLAEMGLAAVAIEYDQANQAVFEEQFTALREWAAKNLPTGDRSQNSENRIENAECWIGFSLGANRTLSYLLKVADESPTPTGGSPVLPLPQLYVRLAGGSQPLDELKIQNEELKIAQSSEFKTQNLKLKTHVLLVHGENDEIFPVSEAREVAAFFQTNGVVTELKILPGKRHAFDSDRAVVIRVVGEEIKAQLTPEHSLPEFPVTKNYPFVLCILPAFLWAGFWIYLRTGNAGDSRVGVGGLSTITQNIENRTSNTEHRKLNKWEIGLRVGAAILVTAAMVQTGIHVITPRLAVSDVTLRIARRFLIPPKWSGDFETLAAKPYWLGQRLKTMLTHVELSNYCVYELINWKIDKEIYDEFVLSPLIMSDERQRKNDPDHVISNTDGAHEVTPPIREEMNWRRPLWEFFYPRIRKENSSEAAAEIVVRHLRERVTIISETSISDARRPATFTGITTLWKDQTANESEFERLYVAALRSVGVGARLDAEGKAEFWTGSQWKRAPRPLSMNSLPLNNR